MKTQNTNRMTALAGILILLAILVVAKRQHQTVQPMATRSLTRVESPSAAPMAVELPSAPTRAPNSVERPLRTVEQHGHGHVDATTTIHIKPTELLATINGVSLTLKDLLPLSAEKNETVQTLTTERYHFLLQRAVERELVFQTARAQGVELTREQKHRLQELRSANDQNNPNVFDALRSNAAHDDFEQRDISGFLLRTTLAEKAGLPSPYVTPEKVEQYYHEHQTEFAQLPVDNGARETAWRRIDADIREKLAPQIQAKYEKELEVYMNRLKSTAVMTVNTTLVAN